MQALSGRRQAVHWGRGTKAADMADFIQRAEPVLNFVFEA
jgi:hypothetical protein